VITREQIMKFAPGAKAELVNAILRNWDAAAAAGIEDNPKRLRRFMASIGVETGGLKSISENLNYTSAQRIYDIFKGPPKNRRFANVKACEPYVRQPEKLAIKVYGGRMGNKAAPSRDGWLYRGAGMMQTTGRDNFRAMGFEDKPDDLRDPEIAFITAVKEWVRRKCNALADKENDEGVRKAINGGLNGYQEYLAYVAKATKVWPVATLDQDGDEEEISRVYTRPADWEADPVEVEPVEDEPPVPRPREERPVTQSTHNDEDTVRRVQSQLWDLGYTEVGSRDTKTGDFDGRIGKMTRTAILAFRNENDLPVNDIIDDDLIAALGTAPKRELAKARSEATTKQIAEQVPEVKANLISRAWTWFLGGGTVGAAGLAGAGEADPDQRGIFKTILRFMQDIPPYGWALLAVAIVGVLIYQNHKALKASKEAFQDGSRR
jgi:predicted chitinase